jgi:esterase/lipase
MNFASIRYGIRNIRISDKLRVLKASSNINIARNYSQLLRKNGSVILLRHELETLIPPYSVIMRRSISTQEVTKNIYLVTEDKRKIETDPKTLRLNQDCGDRPLAIIFSWLKSKPKHLMKYAHLYLDQGFDVAVAQITPWQLLWPVNGAQQVAGDIVKFLLNNEYYQKMVIHGFSVGGYLFGECLVQMNKDIKTYQKVVDRFVGQVWDSAADITEIPAGVPRALFPKNPKLQVPLRNYMKYHLRTFHEPATQHYIRSSQMFHTNFVHAPALMIVSKTDPVGAESSNRRVADSWVSNGIKVTWKCFDHSPHVMHFMKHREEYMNVWFNHLASVSLVKYPEKIRAKL